MYADHPDRAPAGAGGGLDVAATLAQLAERQPGPEVLAIAEQLAELPRGALTDAEQIDLLAVLDACESHIAAVKQRPLSALAARAGEKRTDVARYENIALETSLALRWSESMVHDRLATSRLLTNDLPGTLAALAAGTISYPVAHTVADGASLLTTAEERAQLEARVLTKAGSSTRAEVRRRVEATVMRIDPTAAERRRKRTRAERQVTHRGTVEGAGHLGVTGPAEDTMTIWNALSLGADALRAAGLAANLDQGRFDTLLGWATEHLANISTRPDPAAPGGGLIPGRRPRPTHLTVIVKESTLAGEDDDPAELSGYGPITAQTARDLATGQAAPPGPFDAWSLEWAGWKWANPDAHDFRTEEEAVGPAPPPDPRDEPLPWPDDDDPWPPPDPDGGTGGGGGGSPPMPPSPHTPGSMTTTIDQAPVTTRTLRVDPESGWAMPPDGLRLDCGRDRRFFSARVATYFRDRFRRCSVPTCHQVAEILEADHWEPAAQGGRTDADSGGPGCVHHNRTTRNIPGWTITANGDGTATLTTAHGRQYPITPHDYLGN